MNKDHVVFTAGGFLLGLVVGSFLLGPKLAQSKLAPPPQAAAAEDAAPAMPGAAGPAADGAGGGAATMEMVRQQLDSLKQKIEQNPKDFDALVQLANMYMDVGKYPQAIDYYQQALAVREEPAVRTDLGICFKQSGQTDRAIETFSRVAKEHPEQWQATFNLAIAYAETHRTSEAREQLARLRQMNADPAQVAKLEQAISTGGL